MEQQAKKRPENQAYDIQKNNCFTYLQVGGEHLGNRPPSFSVVLTGAAIARQVQATATTRTKVLTARFIHFLLTCGSPGSGNPSAGIITPMSSYEWEENMSVPFLEQA